MGDTDGMLTNARAAKNIPVYTDKSLIIAGKSVAEIEGAIFDVRGVVEALRSLPDGPSSGTTPSSSLQWQDCR